MGTLLFLEPVGGISGDMTLAALLDLGAPLDAIVDGLDRLALPGWALRRERGSKCGIVGTRVEVVLTAPDPIERTWGEIRALLQGAGLPAAARDGALAIFSALADAEARVHGTTPEKVHFHEVGAIDSIVDVVGVALALAELGADRVFAAPPPLGSGITQSRHGPIPIPAPATLQVLRGRPVRHEGVGERTTPTGAAILAAATLPGPPPPCVPERIGYGIGHKDWPDAANVLRATLAREATPPDALLVLESNLDDAPPQQLAHALAALLDAGALDAWLTPVVMKKGRPGHVLSALAPASLREALVRVMVLQTPTLGVRWYAVEREALGRTFVTVQTAFGPILVKLGLHRGVRTNAAPEWEDCVQAAARHGVAPREVRDAALVVFLSQTPPKAGE